MNRFLPVFAASVLCLAVSCDRLGSDGGKVTQLNVLSGVASPVWTPDSDVLTDTVKPKPAPPVQIDEPDEVPDFTSEQLEMPEPPQPAMVPPLQLDRPAPAPPKEENVQLERKVDEEVENPVLQETASSD